jgi:protein-S-isoprenylcysteine O-methyltransferase Ste14
MIEQRARYRRLAIWGAVVGVLAVIVAVFSFFALAHGSFARVGMALVGAMFLVVVGAQAVFFWAFFAGRLYRRDEEDSRA